MTAQAPASILIALDGSPLSLRALPWARALAGQLHAQLVAVHVRNAASDPEALTRVLGDVPLRLVSGDPAEAIRQEADEARADLLVMTTRSFGDGQREHGSTAFEVATTASRPIFLLRPEAGMEPSALAPRLERLLVPVDGDTATASALQPAVSLARRLGASVDLLFVASARVGGGVAATRYVDQPQHEWPLWEHELKQRLAHAAGAAPGADVPVHMREGDPGEEIVRFAREGGYDALVLVRRSRLEPGRAATLRSVLRGARCPVLLISGAQ